MMPAEHTVPKDDWDVSSSQFYPHTPVWLAVVSTIELSCTWTTPALYLLLPEQEAVLYHAQLMKQPNNVF